MVASVEDVGGGGGQAVPADGITRDQLVAETVAAMRDGAAGMSGEEVRDRIIAETYATSVELQRLLEGFDRIEASGPFGRMLARALRG